MTKPNPPLLVLNIYEISERGVISINRHETKRETDGTSAIDPARRHLNRTILGSTDGPSASLAAFYDGGIQRPDAQAETPYLSLVITASPSYFRPDDPQAAGTWDDGRMEAWLDATMTSLRATQGDDLVHVALHLDEDTPHLHVLIAPTYERQRRDLKRRKRDTDASWERRRVAREAEGPLRRVGRSSSFYWSRAQSYARARSDLAEAVASLGIAPGEDRAPNAPPGLSTREWVRQETVRLREEEQDLAARKDKFAEQGRSWADELLDREQAVEAAERFNSQRETVLDAAERQLDCREQELEEREGRLRRIERALGQMISEVADRLGVGRQLRAIRDAIRDSSEQDHIPPSL